MARLNRSKLKSRREARPVVRIGVVETVPYDETLLDRARTQWQFGDWESLVKLDLESIQHHPQRAKLALLAAAGHFQQGYQNEAYRYIRIAEDWGCSRKLIVQMIISGTHNSLGIADSIIGRQSYAEDHFHHAVNLGGIPGDPDLFARARVTWQRRNN